MFQSICLRRQNYGSGEPPINLGFLAEALLFYQNVRLIADYAVVEQLARQCGPDIFLALMDEGFLTVSYLQYMSAIRTDNTGTNLELHKPVYASTRTLQLQDAAPKIFQNVTGISGKGRRMGLHFARKAHQVTHESDLLQEVREDYASKSYVRSAVKQILRLQAPGYQVPKNFIFHIVPSGENLKIDTNLNFVPVNGQLQLQTPAGISPISPAALLRDLLEVRGDLHFSSLYGGEIATSAVSSALIQVKCRDLLRARLRNHQNIELFQTHFFKNGHALGEAINSGERSYHELLKLLKRAHKFREEFLQKQEPDADLIAESYKTMTSSTWVEELPVKTMRFVILTIASIALPLLNPLVGTVASTGLAAADTFLLDKLKLGWRPNQFVQGPLKEFVQVVDEEDDDEQNS